MKIKIGVQLYKNKFSILCVPRLVPFQILSLPHLWGTSPPQVDLPALAHSTWLVPRHPSVSVTVLTAARDFNFALLCVRSAVYFYCTLLLWPNWVILLKLWKWYLISLSLAQSMTLSCMVWSMISCTYGVFSNVRPFFFACPFTVCHSSLCATLKSDTHTIHQYWRQCVFIMTINPYHHLLIKHQTVS